MTAKDFEIYCDENYPDALTTKREGDRPLFFLGSIWINKNFREDLKSNIRQIKIKHGAHGEIKWKKVSMSKIDFYIDLIDLFFDNKNMEFRGLAVKPDEINWAFHNMDKELGFYKFYYYLIKGWLSHGNTYYAYIDHKTNRDPRRIGDLSRFLKNLGNIPNVQQIHSKESAGIQMADLIVGLVSSKINNTIRSNEAKLRLIQHFEKRLGAEIEKTDIRQRKFNLFIMRLD